MYGQLRKMQQDDMLTGGSAANYRLALSPSDAAYFTRTGGVVMQALLCNQYWIFSVERARCCGPYAVISAHPGHPIVRLRNLEEAAVEA